MAKNNIHEMATNKKPAKKAGWLIVFLVAIFAFLLCKFAFSGSAEIFNGLPDSDVAYSIAKDYIQPTILSTNVNFSDIEYKFAKKSDSIYVIKSFYTEKYDSGESYKINFTITLKYNGGSGTNAANWTMLNLNKDN